MFTAHDGAEALGLLDGEVIPRPCVILLDWLTAPMSGEEFVRALDRRPDAASLPSRRLGLRRRPGPLPVCRCRRDASQALRARAASRPHRRALCPRGVDTREFRENRRLDTEWWTAVLTNSCAWVVIGWAGDRAAVRPSCPPLPLAEAVRDQTALIRFEVLDHDAHRPPAWIEARAGGRSSPFPAFRLP